MVSSDDEPLVAIAIVPPPTQPVSGTLVTRVDDERSQVPSTQPVSGTLPTWVDDERSQAEEPERNVRPRLRERSVSPTILDVLEEDLEASAVEPEATRLFESSSDADEDRFVPSEMSAHAGFNTDHEVSDTETIDSRADSEFGGEELPAEDSSFDEDDVHMAPHSPANLRAALVSLDALDFPAKFEQRAAVMESIPKFLKGLFRNALKLALEEASSVDRVRCVRGWKLLMMLPRMLLHGRPGGRVVSKVKLVERVQMFVRGPWDQLIRASEHCDERAAVSRRRRTRRVGNDIEVRAARAEALVQIGELSSERQALQGAELAPGNRATLGALRNPERRPPQSPRSTASGVGQFPACHPLSTR